MLLDLLPTFDLDPVKILFLQGATVLSLVLGKTPKSYLTRTYLRTLIQVCVDLKSNLNTYRGTMAGWARSESCGVGPTHPLTH